MISINCEGRNLSLLAGECYARECEAHYRDTEPLDVLAAVEDVRAGTPWDEVVKQRFMDKPWLVRIVTAPERFAFYDAYPPPRDALILDVGAGWGQHAIPFAADHRICVVEPTPERMAFIQEVANQLDVKGSMCFVQADYLDVMFDTRFDLINCIGVLEWVGQFRMDMSPLAAQRQCLEKMRRDLTPGGMCVLAIENRLGLKYIMGAPDDHSGVPDINVFDHDLATLKWRERTGETLRVITHSMAELHTMFQNAGFMSVNFFAAFPDYKVPQVIVPCDRDDSLRDYFYGNERCQEHDGATGQALTFQQELLSHYRSLVDLGIARYFAPSYYVIAS